MVFRTGQIFEVKKSEQMIDPKRYYHAYDGSIFLIKEDGQKLITAFNEHMQKTEKVQVQKLISSTSFLGTDGWCWHDWMLNIKNSILMDTE